MVLPFSTILVFPGECKRHFRLRFRFRGRRGAGSPAAGRRNGESPGNKYMLYDRVYGELQ